MYLIGIFGSPFPYLVILGIYLSGFAWIKIQPVFYSEGPAKVESKQQFFASEYGSTESDDSFYLEEHEDFQPDAVISLDRESHVPRFLIKFLPPDFSFFRAVFFGGGTTIRPPPFA